MSRCVTAEPLSLRHRRTSIPQRRHRSSGATAFGDLPTSSGSSIRWWREGARLAVLAGGSVSPGAALSRRHSRRNGQGGGSSPLTALAPTQWAAPVATALCFCTAEGIGFRFMYSRELPTMIILRLIINPSSPFVLLASFVYTRGCATQDLGVQCECTAFSTREGRQGSPGTSHTVWPPAPGPA